MSQNNVVLMHHFIQSTATPYKNRLIQKLEGRELKIYTHGKACEKKNIGLSWDLRRELKLFTSKLDVKTINIILLTDQ